MVNCKWSAMLRVLMAVLVNIPRPPSSRLNNEKRIAATMNGIMNGSPSRT